MRPGTLDDLGAVRDLHRASILELCATHYSRTQLDDWTDSLRPEAYESLVRTRLFLVATESETVLGFGVLDLERCLINATYVSPTAAGRGVGRALVEAMERLARGHGSRELSLHSTLNAVRFYEALGYTRGEQSVNTLPSGVTLPCVLMRKSLTTPSGRSS